MREYRLLICTLIVLIAFLTACTERNNVTNESAITPTFTVTPTQTVTLTEAPTITPTATPIPTNTPTATPSPLPTPLPEERMVSVEELMQLENIVNDYFGSSENMESDMQKRKEYLKSFNALTDTEVDALVLYINLCSLIPENAFKYMNCEYFSICNEKALNHAESAVEKIVQYNNLHEDDQIVISWLGIENALTDCERANINEVQQLTYKMKDCDDRARINASKYWSRSGREYTFFIDGQRKTISVESFDDLSIVCKYFIVCIPYQTVLRICKAYSKDSTSQSIRLNVPEWMENMHNAMLKPEWIHRKMGNFHSYFETSWMNPYNPEFLEFSRKHDYINFLGEYATYHTVGESFVITAERDGYLCEDGEPLVWTSGNESVVMVDQDGMISCVGPGTTEVSVRTWYGLVCSFETTVLEFDFSKINKVIKVGKRTELSVKIEGAEYNEREVMKWTSNDENVAVITRDAFGEYITAVGAGTVTITCYCPSLCSSDSFEFTVEE